MTQDISWVLDSFVADVPGVAHAQAVSTDGIHLAGSAGMTPVQCDQVAAIASGLASLNLSAGEAFGMLPAVRQLLEFAGGWIIVARISETANLVVVADTSANLGVVGYEMTLLGERAGQMLSPDVIAKLKNTLAV